MASLKIFIALCAMIGYACASSSYGDGSVNAGFEVICDDTNMAVFFNKTALDSRDKGAYNNRTYQIYFEGQRNNAACTTHPWDTTKVNTSTATGSISAVVHALDSIHIEANFSDCGINVFADATHIIYNTTVVVLYGQNPNANIGREERDVYNVMCLRNRTVEEDATSLDVKFRQTGSDAKNDTQDFSFTLTHSDINDGGPKSTYNLGDYIKFTLDSNTARKEVKAVIQKCWTNDGGASSYDLITNRCTLEPGSSFISVSDAQTTWKTEAFRYIGGSGNTIYTRCLVRVCLDTQTGGECDLCSAKKRKRRSTGDEEDEHTLGQMILVKSPYFYIVDKDTPSQSNQESSNALSGTNGLIVIILLATLVFVIAAAIIKKVFFTAAAVPVASPVVAYTNKAMA